jgi:hypothetical protein
MKQKIIELLKNNDSLTLGEIAYNIKRDRDIVEIELNELIEGGRVLINDSYYSLPKIELKIMTTKNNNLDSLSELLFNQLNKLTAVNSDIDINQCKAVSNLARDVISIERMKLDEKKMNLDFANHFVEHGDASPLQKLLENGS